MEILESIEPVWVSQTQLSPEWLRIKTGFDCETCTVDPSHIGGLNGSILTKLTAILKDGSSVSLVLKTVVGAEAKAKLIYGFVREALFYQTLAKEVDIRMPAIYHSFGDLVSGVKVILMEDLS